MIALLKSVLEIVQDQNKEKRKDEWMEGRTDGRTDGLGHYNISLTFFNPENNQNQYRKLIYRNLITFAF